ncbi:hypothetical protein [Pseudomonas sp.]|uniref:hypothetical protein n=1 Tax=Pseudomonas sp. TaxID=306 RepID=UPI003A9709E7
MDFRFSQTFGHLQQEGYLVKSSLLSGFDHLLKANFSDDAYGHFYSAFFHLSIGIERILKLAVITSHMIENDFKPLTDAQLKADFGHKINKLYGHTIKIANKHSLEKYISPESESVDFELLEFLTDFANQARYYNLSMVSTPAAKESPLARWYGLAMRVLEDEYSFSKMCKDANKLFYEPEQNMMAGYTYERDFEGHPMTYYDVTLRFRRTAKSAPYMVWRLIKLLKPVYEAHHDISMTAHEIEAAHQQDQKSRPRLPTIPYMYEFFPFLLATRADSIRRKRWLPLF